MCLGTSLSFVEEIAAENSYSLEGTRLARVYFFSRKYYLISLISQVVLACEILSASYMSLVIPGRYVSSTCFG